MNKQGGWQGWRRWLALAMLAAVAAVLGGCASHKYTVDDGRKVNELLLGQIRAYGEGERLVRPAIARTAALKDRTCDKQWELPFSVASSESWSENDRVAWVRALGVDERLTVVAATADSPLQVGDRIDAVAGTRKERDAEALLELLAERRDAGKPFEISTVAGRKVSVAPFEVCRGYTRFAPPSTPKLQDYHWLLSLHPLELTQAKPTDDEALWMVLWTQGLSEEGGARMKTFHYGVKIAGTLYNLVTLATGLKGAALAADAAIKAAQSAAAQLASDLIKQQLIEQAKAYALERMRGVAIDTADRIARAQMVNAMQQAATNRGSLSGVARVGATVFDRADSWAFERMVKLQANPLAGFSLHQKLAELGLAENAFVFDGERLTSISQVANKRGLEEQVVAMLKGLKPEDLDAELGGMPLASAQAGFSYDEPMDTSNNPFARGLIDAMLDMPAESKGKK